MLNTVIIIDDSDVDRYITRRILKKSGIADRVIEMTGAGSALDLLGDRAEFESQCGPCPPPAVILLDINMPYIGGFEFLEELLGRIQRSEIRSDSLVVVMHTSSSDPGDIERARGYAVVLDYIMKPISVAALVGLSERLAAKTPQPSAEYS